MVVEGSLKARLKAKKSARFIGSTSRFNKTPPLTNTDTDTVQQPCLYVVTRGHVQKRRWTLIDKLIRRRSN